MVLLTAAYVEKECVKTQSQKSLTRGIEKNHLWKITHLYMQDKFIDAIVRKYKRIIISYKNVKINCYNIHLKIFRELFQCVKISE